MQKFKSEKGAEDSAILQQALYDRDEAIEKWVYTLASPLNDKWFRI